MVLIALSIKYLPSVPFFNRVILSKELDNGTGMETFSEGGEREGLVGKAVTDLRPAGKGEFNGEVLDIAAATGFITSGQNIVITEEDGMRILVELADEV